MRIRCAWCLALLGEKAPREQAVSTHGICSACLFRITGQRPGPALPARPGPEGAGKGSRALPQGPR